MTYGRSQKTLYSSVFACGKSRDREKLVQGGAVNASVMGMVVVGIRLMTMRVSGNGGAMTFGRGRRDSLTAFPCRSSPGKKQQETASDDNQAFHL